MFKEKLSSPGSSLQTGLPMFTKKGTFQNLIDREPNPFTTSYFSSSNYFQHSRPWSSALNESLLHMYFFQVRFLNFLKLTLYLHDIFVVDDTHAAPSVFDAG
jgi:hypothetical protein